MRGFGSGDGNDNGIGQWTGHETNVEPEVHLLLDICFRDTREIKYCFQLSVKGPADSKSLPDFFEVIQCAIPEHVLTTPERACLHPPA
ncbi:hypothetical protein LDENG_00245280 [Lucifuga dentata]|nr:hypothetical protein LDENG_00245280 [Lucifuga dentata]